MKKMDEGKIKKGRSILALKICTGKKAESKYGLDKVPIEALYKLALEQIGAQESYIEELEERVRSFDKEAAEIRREERISVLAEVRKDAIKEAKMTEYVQRLERRLSKQGTIIKHLYESRSLLAQEIARLQNNLSSSAKQIESNS